jgi:hypothetical protein
MLGGAHQNTDAGCDQHIFTFYIVYMHAYCANIELNCRMTWQRSVRRLNNQGQVRCTDVPEIFDVTNRRTTAPYLTSRPREFPLINSNTTPTPTVIMMAVTGLVCACAESEQQIPVFDFKQTL